MDLTTCENPIFIIGFPRSGTRLDSLRFEPGDDVFAAGDSRLYSESARDRVTPADAREHFPERVQNAIH